jgi:hypothetical protein
LYLILLFYEEKLADTFIIVRIKRAIPFVPLYFAWPDFEVLRQGLGIIEKHNSERQACGVDSSQIRYKHDAPDMLVSSTMEEAGGDHVMWIGQKPKDLE